MLNIKRLTWYDCFICFFCYSLKEGVVHPHRECERHYYLGEAGTR